MCFAFREKESEKFECFLSAIFYVGKGTSSNPREHMYLALKESEKQVGKKC